MQCAKQQHSSIQCSLLSTSWSAAVQTSSISDSCMGSMERGTFLMFLHTVSDQTLEVGKASWEQG